MRRHLAGRAAHRSTVGARATRQALARPLAVPLLAGALLAIAAVAQVRAQNPPVTAPGGAAAPFVGEWDGAGSLFGAPFRGRVVFEPALEGAFLRLRFDSRMDRGSGFEPLMSAEAYYDIGAGGAVSGGWFDTRGVQMALEGNLVGGALTVVWTAPTERGRTTYRLREDGTMEVVDEVVGAEGWREFGRALYSRSEPPGE